MTTGHGEAPGVDARGADAPGAYVETEEPEAYSGPLELRYDGATVTAEAHLSGFFQPIDGSFRWQGRLQPGEALAELAGTAGRKEIEVRVPGGPPVPAKLGETNPWGGYRISGRGRPPF